MAAIAQRGFPMANLHGVAEGYEDARRFRDLHDLARAVIADNPHFDCWYAYLVQSLVELGHLDEAEAAMPSLVRAFEPDDPTSLLAAMRFHRARGDRSTEAMLYHAGMKWVTYFKGASKSLDAKRYGDRPASLATQFVAWLDRWTGIMTGDIAKQPGLHIWSAWLHELGAKLVGARSEEVVVEERRREAVVGELAAVRDEKSAQAIFERIEWFVTPHMVTQRRVLEPMCTHAPKTAFAILARARANQALSPYTGSGEEAVMLSLALSVPILRKELRAAYETAIRTGTAVHDQHVDRACAAMRLGLRDAALGHLRDALSYLARYYGADVAKATRAANEIRRRVDFAELRGDEAFEELFAPKSTAAAPKTKTRSSGPGARKAGRGKRVGRAR